MTAQEYLEKLIEDCRIYSEKSTEYKDVYAKLFPNLTGEQDVKSRISNMNDDELFEYFKSSQVMLDIQTIYNKLASFVYFCKNTGVDLDLEKMNEVNGLTNFVSNITPFNTEYITTSEGGIKEKNIKQFKSKFEEFKKSLGIVIKMT
jgi:hypothetical protein